MKRESCRAIVITDGQLMTMYREKEGRKYYIFPGGGMENDESEIECVKREALEEFGIVVEPIKKVYRYENEKTIQHFYVCDWVSGEFGSGEGEEFQGDESRGFYRPTLVKISDIGNIPLMPPEITEKLVLDFEKYGEELSNEVQDVIVE